MNPENLPTMRFPHLRLSIKSETLYYLPGLVLLFLMLAVPAAYQLVKGLLIGIIMVEIGVVSLSSKKVFIHRYVLVAFLAFILVGLLHSIHGALRGNPGTLAMAKETVLYVIVYMVLITGVRSENAVIHIHRTLVGVTYFICLYLLVTFLNGIGLWPDSLYVNLYGDTSGSQAVGVGVWRVYGIINVDSSCLPSLLFLQPYLMTIAMLDKSRPKRMLIGSIILSTIVMLFVGRRVLLIVGVTFPVMIFFLLLLLAVERKALLRRACKFLLFSTPIFAAVILLAIWQVNFDLSNQLNQFFEGIGTSSGTLGVDVRVNQFFALLHGWMESPIFGAGSGAANWRFLRSTETPWLYELSYMKYLFDFGIVGFTVYASGILLLYLAAFRIYKLDPSSGQYLLAAILGNAGMLIGNATNPYFLKIDYLSTLFMPVAFLNLWLIKYEQRNFLKHYRTKVIIDSPQSLTRR